MSRSLADSARIRRQRDGGDAHEDEERRRGIIGSETLRRFLDNVRPAAIPVDRAITGEPLVGARALPTDSPKVPAPTGLDAVQTESAPIRRGRARMGLVARRLSAAVGTGARRAGPSIPAPIPPASAIRRLPTSLSPAAPGLGTVSTPRRALPSLAGEFLTELERHRRERPQPLPARFRAVADAVVGPRRVAISSDAASRQALRRVGKRAATTDAVIHLDRPAHDAQPEVIAHELAHVARPSPAPRFFDDPIRNPEERRAEELARIMKSAPVLPRVSGAADASTSPPSSSPSGTLQRQWARGSVSASALADRLTGTIAAGRQRAQSSPPVATPAPASAAAVAHTASPPPSPTTSDASRPAFSGVRTSDSLDQFARLLEMLEERIVVELERRGGRFRGGF